MGIMKSFFTVLLATAVVAIRLTEDGTETYAMPNVADTFAMADNMSGNDGSTMPPMNDGSKMPPMPPMNDGDKMPPMPPMNAGNDWGKTMPPSADMSEGMDDMMNAGNDWDKTMGPSATQDKWGKTMYPSADMSEGMDDKPDVADTMAMADMKTPDMAGYETPNVADTM